MKNWLARWSGMLALTSAVMSGVRAELRLVADAGGREYNIDSIRAGRLIVKTGSERTFLPLETPLRLTGELRSAGGTVRWSPNYQLRRPAFRDGIPAAERRSIATIRVWHNPTAGVVPAPLRFFQVWSKPPAQPGFLLFCWVVDGKIVRTRAQLVKSVEETLRVDFLETFVLSEAEARGHGAVLFWSEGRFVPPVPLFKDALAQRALDAIASGDGAGLRALLQQGLNVNAPSESRSTLLHLAAECGNEEAAGLLLERGASPTAKDQLQMMPLELAAWRGRSAVLERLFAAKPPPEVTARAIAIASFCGHEELAQALLGRHDVAHPLERQMLLACTLLSSQPGLAADMLARGTKFDFGSVLTGRALIDSAARGQEAMVTLWLKRGVPPNAAFQGITPLRAAAPRGTAALARVLLAAGARAGDVDAAGFTPLLQACAAGNSEFAGALLDAGANANAPSPMGLTALHLAVLRGKPELAARLISQGADIDSEIRGALRPLEIATVARSRTMVQLLVQHGASVTTRALAAALAADMPEVVEAARAGGMRLEDVDLHGWSALEIARAYGAAECLKLFPAEDRGTTERSRSRRIVPASVLDAMPGVLSVRMPDDPPGADGIAGPATVEVEVIIDEKGRCALARVRGNHDARLAVAALAASSDWRFSPPKQAGEPVCTQLRVPLNFPGRLDEPIGLEWVDSAPQLGALTDVDKSPDTGADEENPIVRFTVERDGTLRDLQLDVKADEREQRLLRRVFENMWYVPGLRDGKTVAVRTELAPVIMLFGSAKK